GGQLVPVALDGHLALGHCLEERGLRLRGRSVDLVREDDVREDGALTEREATVARREYVRARDVRGEKVRRELDAPRARAERLRECLYEGGLRHARPALEADVAVREERDDHHVERTRRTDEDALDLTPELVDSFLRCERLPRGLRIRAPDRHRHGCAPWTAWTRESRVRTVFVIDTTSASRTA